jgi:CubicO group peptidase (beta-lactamase class C family)
MRLVEKGILDLDKPLYQYLPFEEVAHDDRYKLITARHVLSHQTGFPNWAERNEKGQFDLKFTPGTDFGYSGEGFEYLKRVVEHITQKDIGTILEEELLIPLHWKHVYFQGSKYVAEFAAHGHYDNSPTDIRLIKKPMMAYSMNTEAKSFSTFMLALRNKKGLKPETYKEMFKIHAPREDSVHWGLGFSIENSPYGLVYGHGGSTSSGFICNFSFFQAIDMGYVLFTNSHMGEWLAIPLLTEFLITGKDDKE